MAQAILGTGRAACSCHISWPESRYIYFPLQVKKQTKNTVLNTLSIRIRAGGPWRLLYVLGYVKQRLWVGTIHGCKPAMLSSSRNPLHFQNEKCAPAGETDNPGATEPDRGLFQAPAAWWVSCTYTATTPTSFLLHFLLRVLGNGCLCKIPNSVTVLRDTCQQSQVQRPQAAKGSNCDHSPPCEFLLLQSQCTCQSKPPSVLHPQL